MPSTLLLGLDGATFDVLRPLWTDGTMPFLSEFARRGSCGVLETVLPPLTPPAWTSLITGRSPGHHGIFDFVRVSRTADALQSSGPYGEQPGAGPLSVRDQGPPLQYRMATSTDVRSETLWSLASRQGRRVAALNFPVGIPPQPIEGYSVAGFAPWRHLRRAVWPPDFYDTLAALSGFRPQELVFDIERERRAIQVLAADEYEDWINFHVRREERWLQVVQHLLERGGCDLVAVLFDGVDKLQHRCWRFIDPTAKQALRSPWERHIATLCRSYFSRLDEILAEIVALSAPAQVFLASDHGFGPTSRLFYVNAWLCEQGYLAWAPGVAADDQERVGLDESTRSSAALFDWTRTLACALTSGSNGIYINVSRRAGEPGVPADDYDTFRADLRSRLLGVRDSTGAPVVADVFTREDAFPGPQMERAPDLTLRLSDDGFVSVLHAAEPLVQRREVVGTHRPEGVFIAGGPGVRSGQVLPPLSILDVAPALLYSLDLPVPGDMEGRLPAAVFDDRLLQQRPPRVASPAGNFDGKDSGPDNRRAPLRPAAPDIDAAEDEQVLRRLKALGYVE